MGLAVSEPGGNYCKGSPSCVNRPFRLLAPRKNRRWLSRDPDWIYVAQMRSATRLLNINGQPFSFFFFSRSSELTFSQPLSFANMLFDTLLYLVVTIIQWSRGHPQNVLEVRSSVKFNELIDSHASRWPSLLTYWRVTGEGKGGDLKSCPLWPRWSRSFRRRLRGGKEQKNWVLTAGELSLDSLKRE